MVHQKSCEKWMTLCDKNTRNFYSNLYVPSRFDNEKNPSVKKKKKENSFHHTQNLVQHKWNKICGLFLDDTTWSKDQDHLKKELGPFVSIKISFQWKIIDYCLFNQTIKSWISVSVQLFISIFLILIFSYKSFTYPFFFSIS